MPLRTPGDAWHGVADRYLREAGCPFVSTTHPFSTACLPEYLDWLAGNAISMSFEDKGEGINLAASAEMARAHAGPATIADRMPVDAVDVPPAAAGLIRELAALVRVSVEGRGDVETLQAVHRVIRQRLLPVVGKEEAASTGATSAATPKVKKGGSVKSSGGLAAKDLLDVKTFPLGFTTGDEVVDRAATILRMLYVADLRELQDAVNEILVSVQEFTANPKTDSSLGVVGR